jgi:CRP-like cAMP-binding protein
MVIEGFERVIRRFESRAPLGDRERDAIRALPVTRRTLAPSTYMIREGEPPEYCSLLLAGFAFRHKVTGAGERQILAVHIPGEFLDLQNALLGIADHHVQALTRCEVALVPVQALQAITSAHPTISRAMWIDTLIDAAIFREWIVNVGRRDSISRIAHLLCEFALRLSAAGLAEKQRYELPMTQEQIADAVGLTPVHVNRVLKQLGQMKLIDRDKRSINIADWKGLREIGDFNSRYLHFEAGAAIDLQPAVRA